MHTNIFGLLKMGKYNANIMNNIFTRISDVFGICQNGHSILIIFSCIILTYLINQLLKLFYSGWYITTTLKKPAVGYK